MFEPEILMKCNTECASYLCRCKLYGMYMSIKPLYIFIQWQSGECLGSYLRGMAFKKKNKELNHICEVFLNLGYFLFKVVFML